MTTSILKHLLGRFSRFLRLAFLFGLLIPALGAGISCRPASPRSPAEQTLIRACTYLWNQQGEDGGWHSRTHGLLQIGQALTPYILFALLETPDSVCEKPDVSVRRGLDFIRRHTNPAGVLGFSDPDVVEYPNYATAYALRILVRQGEAADTARIEAMKTYLLGQQFTEQRGIRPEHPAYGGWGFGEANLPEGHVGHGDLSHTRRILQALREAGHTDPEPYRNAQRLLRFLQKHPDDPRVQTSVANPSPYDGGFFASTAVPAVNKSAPLPNNTPDRPQYHSYATATADGLLALLATGQAPGDEPVHAAMQWLQNHPDWSIPAGIPADAPYAWDEVMFFYHLSVRAEAYAALRLDSAWHADVLALLAEHQLDDGRFYNPFGALNKEDDPLLATAMVVGILSRIVSESPHQSTTDPSKAS